MSTCQLPEFLSHCTRPIEDLLFWDLVWEICSKLSTGITLQWAPVSILFDVGVPLEDKVIFQWRGLFSIWEMLTKFSGFFWKIYCIKEKFALVKRRWFSFGLFSFVDNFSIALKHFLKFVFLLQAWQTCSSTWHLPRWWEFSQNLHFLIISVAWAEVWLLDFECFEILFRSMVSFYLRISRACLRVSSAWPAGIALERVNSDSRRKRSLKNYHYCHKQ